MRTRALLSVLLLSSVTGCYSVSSYTGDGTLADIAQGVYRYELSLSDVTLSEKRNYLYTLSGLPRDTFILGLHVQRLGPGTGVIFEVRPVHALIRLRVLNEHDEVVIAEENDLSRWVWSGAQGDADQSFVYQRGSTRELPIGGGSVHIEEIGKLSDDGWGTYFKPRRRGVYRVDLTVLQGDTAASQFRVQLVAYGGERFYL
jgi:hypothetical protein